jgi:hypothetical protein
MTWSGPNLPAGTASVLNIQNINRNQTGDYQCTASNDVSSKTSVVVNVVVKCKYYIEHNMNHGGNYDCGSSIASV